MTEQARLRVYFAAHYFCFTSERGIKIAAVLGISTPRLYAYLSIPKWRETWHEALHFWGFGENAHNAVPKGYAQYRYEKRKAARQEANDDLRLRGELPNDLNKAESLWADMLAS